MPSWLKLGYHPAAGEDPRYWLELPWISDGPGRLSSRWNRKAPPRIGQIHPPYGPRYQLGDRLVMYLTGPKKCPAILEVTAEPCWDPDRVDREAAPGEGDRWGVLTEVKRVAAPPAQQRPRPAVARCHPGVDCSEGARSACGSAIRGGRASDQALATQAAAADPGCLETSSDRSGQRGGVCAAGGDRRQAG